MKMATIKQLLRRPKGLAFKICVVTLFVTAANIVWKYEYVNIKPLQSFVKRLKGTSRSVTSGNNDAFTSGSIERSVTFPKTIFMLWDKGWSNAPPLHALCLETARRQNPDFTVRAMSLAEAEAIIDRPAYYSDAAWTHASIQAKSDIIRVELLATFGGVWFDATIYCNRPLASWLSETVMKAGFFVYHITDKRVKQKTYPWIGPWFLVAIQNSTIMKMWREETREAWKHTPLPPDNLGYYWVHRLFRNLTVTNTEFYALYKNMPFIDAQLSLCKGPEEIVPPIYRSKCKRISSQLGYLDKGMRVNETFHNASLI